MLELKETSVVTMKKTGPKPFSRWLIAASILLLVLLVIVSILYVLSRHSDTKGIRENESHIKRIQSFEDTSKGSAQSYLGEKDYERYQLALIWSTSDYIEAKDYPSAEKLLNTILDTVPADKLTVNTYTQLSKLYKAKHDDKKYHQYTELLINKLNQQGLTEEAKLYKEQLGKI